MWLGIFYHKICFRSGGFKTIVAAWKNFEFLTDQIGLPGREVQFEVFADFDQELDQDEPEEVETVLTETAQSLKIYAERMGQKLDSGNQFKIFKTFFLTLSGRRYSRPSGQN